MKTMWIATAVLAAAMTVAGCKERREEPVPGPKAAPPASSSMAPATDLPSSSKHPAHELRHRGASGISWFQGTLEEAFSTTCPRCSAGLFPH